MCLFTSARTVAIVFARSAGSEAMYCAGVFTFDGGFMDWSSSRTKCVTERSKTSRRQGCKYRVCPSRAQAIWAHSASSHTAHHPDGEGFEPFIRRRTNGIPVESD